MNIELLESTAKALSAPGKGILAADESAPSCAKRFEAVGVECTEETRRQYRQILIETPGNEAQLSGIIFYDETFWQKNDAGETFAASAARRGILPGIKVDEGLVDLPGFPGEKISKGLDTLPERLAKYRDAGARFAKWRSVIQIQIPSPQTSPSKGEGADSADSSTSAQGEGVILPTDEAIAANCFVLARYARLCQEFDIVPIVEPEVLFDGTHTAERCQEVTALVYAILFDTLDFSRVHIPGAILKTGMVLPGKESGIAIDASDVAMRTVGVFRGYVPQELGGVVFLSGGQTPDDAFRNLAAIVQGGPHPWGLTFSYSRALQDPVLKYWAANREDRAGAEKVFSAQLDRATKASRGEFIESDAGAFVSAGQDT